MFRQLRGITCRCRHLPFLLLLLAALLLAGCAQMGSFNSEARNELPEEKIPPQPYHPAEFRDLLIPSELDWVRDKSMVVKTDSFAGGVLYFTGRVEVNSLTDYFITSMRNSGWKLVGSVKYKDVLMAFNKPYKTSTIVISEAEMGRRANVSIYITEEIVKEKGSQPEAATPQPRPFSF
ncbi:hypothetical protein ACHHRT_01825 [Desulfurivibrio sp. D14AmB]|uniref:hypothetical protein n=1 Tax=Desulfurivibrio sp. D14AmB TaxID=3374370 RepID=UPI00376F1CF3